jgi:hypothetical protein
LYVLDTEATLRLPEIINPGAFNRFLDELVPLVQDGTVCLSDVVIKECRRIATDEVISVWLHAVASSRQYKNVPYSCVVDVLSKCQGILDVDEPGESGPVSVAALARFVSEVEHASLWIVSEDSVDLPTRMCLINACNALGFKVMRAHQFVSHIGLANMLRACPA